MADDTTLGEEGLENVTPSGAPPRRRLKTAEAARTVFEDLKDDSEERARQWARIQGQYDRNPPYDPDELLEQGRGYQTNVNTGEMESIIDVNTAAAHEALIEVDSLIRVRVRREFLPPGEETEFGEIIAEEYSDLLRGWEGFFYNCDLATKDSFKYGLGVMLWPHEQDWRSRAFKASSLLFPPRARNTVEDLDLFALRDEMSVRDLFEIIQDEEAARDAGWNVSFVKKVIVDTYQMGRGGGGEDEEYSTSIWESVQQKIKNNDPTAERQEFSGVRIVHMAVRELDDGRVTHLIFAEDLTEHNEFLFEGVRRYPSMHSLLWLVTYDHGDGFLRSIKGMGHRAFMHTDLSNRLFSSIVDGGILSSGLLLQPSSGTDISRMDVLRMGAVTVIPPGLQIIQSSFTPPINQLIPLRQMSSSLLDNNLGVFRARPENPLQRPVEKTAAQVQSEEAKEARFEKNRATHRYLAWDRWHRETLRRLLNPEYLFAGIGDSDDLVDDRITFFLEMMSEHDGDIEKVIEDSGVFLPGRKEALMFFSRLLRRNVPSILLFTAESLRVEATRAIGLGSESVRLTALNNLMQARGSMDEFGKRTTEREWAASLLGGFHNVDKFFPASDRDKIPSNESSIASLENNDMREGRFMPVGVNQLHGVHLATHFADVLEAIQMFSQDPAQMPIQDLVLYMSRSLPHIGGHIELQARDPSRVDKVEEHLQLFQQLSQTFQQLSQQAEQIALEQERRREEEVRRVQELQAKADDNEVKLAAEKHRIDREMELRALETQSLNASREAKTQVAIETKIRQVVADMMLDQQKTIAEIQNQAAKTQAEVQKIQVS